MEIVKIHVQREKVDHDGRGTRGSLTIEAALALSFFLMTMLSWILVMESIRVESVCSHALDQTALALSSHLTMAYNMEASEALVDGFHRKAGKPVSLGDEERKMIRDSLSGVDASLLFESLIGRGKGKPQSVHRVRLSTDIDEEKDRIRMGLDYQMDLPGFLRPFGPLSMHQVSYAGLWRLTDNHRAVDGEEDSDEKKEPEASIWDATPFVRGRVFAQRLRERSEGMILARGQVMDQVTPDGTLVTFHSMNLFSSSYSHGKGIRAEAYQLNDEAIFKNLKTKARQLKKTSQRRKTVTLDDGREIEIHPGSFRLVVVVPEEAAYFRSALNGLGAAVLQREGVMVQFQFEEKAWRVETQKKEPST